MPSKNFGEAVIFRVGIRERAKLQYEVVRSIYTSHLKEKVVLTGGTALHRVYLHKRSTTDLDFLLSKEYAEDIKVVLRENSNLQIEIHDKIFITPREISKGNLFRNIRVSIDMNFWPEEKMLAQYANYTNEVGEAIKIKARPLEEILTDKLSCVMRRNKVTDFVDLWWGLQAGEKVYAKIKSVRIQRNPLAGIYLGRIIEQLDSVESIWEEALAPIVEVIPSIDVVRNDLKEWLNYFEV